MRVLVVSDSHGDFSTLRRIYERERKGGQAGEKPLDLLIHLGDGAYDAMLLQRMTGIRVEAVNGNNDPRGAFPDELCIQLEGIRVYMTHGHNFGVRAGLQLLARAARKERAGLVLFGHTHQDLLVEKRGLTLLNPGAASHWGGSSYALLEIEGKRYKITCCRL